LSNLVFEPLPVPQSTAEFLHSSLWCFNAFSARLLFSVQSRWRAIIELWRDPFGWAKTEHGLAKSCRS
jgi:hypothetical protein